MPGLVSAFERATRGQPPSRQVAAERPRLPIAERQYLPAWGGSEWAFAQYVRDELK
jgi:hypothetical protein